MTIEITPFETRYLDQLERLPPENWQSSAYDLFMHNEWTPWFHPFQVVVDQQKLIGFGMIFHFDDVAWLGWILVHHNYRKQGIGTQMSQFLIDKSRSLGATKLLLTATELGAPIYEKLGFRTTGFYHFMNIPEKLNINIEKNMIRQAKKKDLEAISKIDRLATAENRFTLLENHLDAIHVYENNEMEGFYIENLGSGLVIASTQKAGEQLTAFRINKKNTMVIVPDGNTDFLNELKENKFVEKFRIPRMVLGEEPDWKPKMIYNRGSGYCG